jgi:uncharacterized membrane protein YdjX (TVP38/TMEM64 family)
MRRTTCLLVALTIAAIAVPLVPFLLFGARLDMIVARWLDPRPAPVVLAAMEIGVLAADLLLPVPSSLVATLGGAELGIAAGTACAWLGMTLGSLAGWWLGRTAGQRPVPLLAEAATLLAGATGMRFRDFLAAAALGNLAVALAWSIAGRLGQKADSLQWVLVASLAVPVAAAWLLTRPAHHARR